VRQLDRQIGSQFYERTALSKDKAAMLVKGAVAKAEDAVTPGDAIKDPYVLEFLDLKDEYSESDLEAALIRRLEDFLLELGEGFTFVGRQRRLRIDQTWYRVDLLFFHRKLRCLVIIDLKLGSLTHADVGQMHMYCNYAKEHWAYPEENPPVGLILCADKGSPWRGMRWRAYPPRSWRRTTGWFCRIPMCCKRNWKARGSCWSLAERFVPRRGSGRHTCGAIRLFGDWAEPQSVVGFTAFFREEEEGNDGKHSNKRSA
jgi:predicted nuclease of restriction endonuclease-like (RecB) superfamily